MYICSPASFDFVKSVTIASGVHQGTIHVSVNRGGFHPPVTLLGLKTSPFVFAALVVSSNTDPIKIPGLIPHRRYL
jgi:hypothetical protein